MGFSNYLIGILNITTIVLSVPIVGGGIWLATKHSTDCIRFLQWPVTVIGIFILFVSLAGFLGVCCRVSSLLWIYLFAMFLLMFLLLFFTVFAFVVTNDGAGHALAGKGFREYRLEDYSTWLQKKVDDAQSWNRIRSCLADAEVCDNLNDEYPTLDAFSRADLSPLQSGCCKPPSACQFMFENATEWDNATNSDADPDCLFWTNEDLCFSCNSCRAGVLQNVIQDWRRIAILNIIVLILLIIVYSIGCCAFHDARREGTYSPYGKPYV